MTTTTTTTTTPPIPTVKPLDVPEPSDDLPIIGETPVTLVVDVLFNGELLLTWASAAVVRALDSGQRHGVLSQGHALIGARNTNLVVVRLQHKRLTSYTYEHIFVGGRTPGARTARILQAATSPDLFAALLEKDRADTALRRAKSIVHHLRVDVEHWRKVRNRNAKILASKEADLHEAEQKLKALKAGARGAAEKESK